MSPQFVLAHFGHWYVSVLYLGPVVVVVAFLSFQSWRDRRHGPDDDGEV